MRQRTSSTPLRPSACPGLLRIVPALDGGICRIKLSGGSITAAQALAVAEAAERYASGVIEATNRANLQIRGIGEQQDALIDRLLDAGLGPDHADGDDVRNLMLSPTAGIDPQQLFDARPLAAQILDTLQNQMRFHDLSPKFALLLDAGEGLVMRDHPHDLWLSAVLVDGEILLAFGLAGCPAEDAPLGTVPLSQAHDLVVAVLDAFLELARPEQTRMRHVLAEMPVEVFVQRVSQRMCFPVGARLPAMRPSHPTSSLADEPPSRASVLLQLGVYQQSDANLVAVGAAIPVGRLDTSMLRTIARLATDYGDATLRFTPWQSLLLPNIPVDHASTVLNGLHAAGLVCDGKSPWAQLIACTGAAGCGKGLADTKADALVLAAQFEQQGISRPVHLTGCPRSCAAAHVAPVTLLATSAGHYDLYFRDTQQPGFGVLRARDLTIEAVGALLAADSRSSTRCLITFATVRRSIATPSRPFAPKRGSTDSGRPRKTRGARDPRLRHGRRHRRPALFRRRGHCRAQGVGRRCADSLRCAHGRRRHHARPPAGQQSGDLHAYERSVPAMARELGNTRSAAALELWRPHLEGSVVVIGNAPTALFHLLDMLDAGAPKPALILGFPVGFVGAAESKAMLAADSRGVPFVIMQGRRGGSAMAAAAVNALATEIE